MLVSEVCEEIDQVVFGARQWVCVCAVVSSVGCGDDTAVVMVYTGVERLKTAIVHMRKRKLPHWAGSVL